MNDLLRIDNITKIFNQSGRNPVTALDHVEFSLQEGEFVSLLGASGCGKSTLLRIVAGLDAPTDGTVWLDRNKVWGPGRDRGMVFQQYTLFPWRTARQNVEFALRDASKSDRKELASNYLEVVGLTTFADHFPSQLSGGMQQRVAIARALALRPRIMLMDEPFGALDAQTRSLMQELLLNIWEQDRLSVLFVTHDVEESLILSDRVCVLAARPGRVREIVNVNLPRPRVYESQNTPNFLELKRHVHGLIHEEAVAATGLGAILARSEYP